MAARPQWYFASIGLTNKFQPYCRLATAAMQITPMRSCTQGFANGDCGTAFFVSLAAKCSSPSKLRRTLPSRVRRSQGRTSRHKTLRQCRQDKQIQQRRGEQAAEYGDRHGSLNFLTRL